MVLCVQYQIKDPSDAESMNGKIHSVLIDKFEYNKFEEAKEPSSVL